MTEYMDKTTLLDAMQSGYTAFEALLASLSEQQMTTPGVNGKWSIKDNIAHLGTWQRHEIERDSGALQGVEPVDSLPDMTEDDANEYFYQQNRNRSLDEVLAEFRATYQQLVDIVQAMSNKDLNRPVAWLDNRPIGFFIPGNTYEHYQEHGKIIQEWLTKVNSGVE